MNLAAATVVVAVLAGFTMHVVDAPLMRLLVEACDGEARAHFWWRLCVAELTMGTALSAALGMLVPATTSLERALWVVRLGCIGLLLGLAAVTLGARRVAAWRQ